MSIRTLASLENLGFTMFPAPLEVDRYLYAPTPDQGQGQFPAPLKVDRYLYECDGMKEPSKGLFPAPREVDRWIYRK